MPRSKATDHPPPVIVTETETKTEPDEPVAWTFDQLPIEDRLRLEHAEKWVAWAPDWQSVIASGDDFNQVYEAARLAGFPRAFMEWLPPANEQCELTGPVGMSIDQIPIKARLRLEHAEKWVAWAPNEESVLAAGDDFQAVHDAAVLAGHPLPLMEWVAFAPIRSYRR